MATQIKGSQIQDGTITGEDVDDALERELTKARATADDSTPGFLSSKIVPGSGVTIDVVGAAGQSQTLRINAPGGGGGGGGASLILSGASGDTQYYSAPSTVVFDDGTGFQVADAGGGAAKITIASHFKHVLVQGYETLTATGSDQFEVIGSGGISVYTNIIDTMGTPASKELFIDATVMSSSLASRIADVETNVSASFFVQEQTSFGMSPVVGGSRLYARADHIHGTPSIPYGSTVVSETSYGQSPSAGVSSSVARADHTHGTPASSQPEIFGLFGTGYDGDVTVTGVYTQTQPREWMNLTVTAGAQYKPAGFPILVRGTLTIETGASVNDDGNSTTNNLGGAGLGGRGYLDAQSTAGGAGWSVSALTNANGNVSTAITMTMPNRAGLTPRGGNGGNSTTRSGGVAGTASQMTTGARLSQAWANGRHPSGPIKCGSGGGGGALTVTTGTATVSGGGGSGGGFVYICASQIANSGRISANGGNGASASVTTASNSAGGGGGGGGGCVLIVTETPASELGTVQANGGTGGAAAGTGSTAGAAGTDGSVHVVSFGGA